MMDRDQISDQELDRLLAQASRPELPPGFEDRLLRRMAAQPSPQTMSNVIAFPAVRAKPRLVQWLAMVPLASALAGGFYVGSATDIPNLLSGSDAVASLDEGTYIDFTDLELISQEEQS